MCRDSCTECGGDDYGAGFIHGWVPCFDKVVGVLAQPVAVLAISNTVPWLKPRGNTNDSPGDEGESKPGRKIPGVQGGPGIAPLTPTPEGGHSDAAAGNLFGSARRSDCRRRRTRARLFVERDEGGEREQPGHAKFHAILPERRIGPNANAQRLIR
jgi:hypothetical protein